eukprot:4475116-Amphidinium_carterae.1
MQSELYQVASEQAQSQVRIAGSCVTSLVDCVRPRVQDVEGNTWLSTQYLSMPSYYVLPQETKEGEKEAAPLVGMTALRKSLTSLMDKAGLTRADVAPLEIYSLWFDADMLKILTALVSKATSDTKSARKEGSTEEGDGEGSSKDEEVAVQSDCR